MRALRGRDPVTVEIEVNALSAKPLNQIAPANVADLCALAELTDLPAGIRVRLKGFGERIARAIGDLPNGEGFQEYASALADVPPERVPSSLRQVFVNEVENTKRTDKERAVIGGLRKAWEEVDPEPFVMTAPIQPVRQLPAARDREERPRALRERAPREHSTTPKITKVTTERDPARSAWIRQVVLERLSGAVEQGLLETVLVAGIRHRARERYPDLSATEIVAVLRELESIQRCKHSAGRWRLPTRF